MKNYLIGIDIGTQGTKTSLFNTDGFSVAESFEASRLISPRAGIVEQDADEIYFSVIHTIREVMIKSGVSAQKVAAIGIDGQMAGIMGIDGNWNAVTYYDSWLDTRCEKYMDFIKQQGEEEVISITGSPVTYAHGPKILWWKYERPDVYKKIKKFVVPSAYVAGRMAGLKADEAFIDYTHLHFSGFADVCKKEWSDKLLEQFMVDENKMPVIVEPWKIVGYLSKEAASLCGLIGGIPIVAGCGDQLATSLATGIFKKGIIMDGAGTASVLTSCVDRYVPDVENKTFLNFPSIIPGLWNPLSHINGGGLCIKWFRDELTGKDNPAGYNKLDEETIPIQPGSDNLIFIPHFGGRACPNIPSMRGSWIGLNWAHSRSHMYKSIMESIAYEYKIYLDILKKLLGEMEFTKVITIGGGAKSRVFNSIKADVLGIPYVRLKSNNTATLGSAVVAGYGTGVYSDIQSTIEKLVVEDDWIEPNWDNHEKYKKYAELYKNLLIDMESSFKRFDF